jgi:serine/threonine protein kinase
MKKKIGDYIMQKKIGSGAFGEVFFATKLNSNEEFAIKMMSKSKMSERLRSYLDREIEILQILDNPYIIKLKDLKVSEHNYYLIFEYGGDLADYKKANGGKINELTTRRLMRQIVSALYTVYASGGIHRDIKLSNILLHYATEEDRKKDTPISKLCDFGFARMIETAGNIEVPLEMSIVGTPLNMSPELLQQKPYTVKSDMWSLGTITYELLCGVSAFTGLNRVHLTKMIEVGAYKVPKSLSLSTEAINFLTSCLQYNFNDRMNWEELKSHPFICTDTITPFLFEMFKQDNPKVEENKNYYLFSSKVHYNFTTIYNKAKGTSHNTIEELKLKKQEEEENKLLELKNLELEKKEQKTEKSINSTKQASNNSVQTYATQNTNTEAINEYFIV